MLKQWEGLPTTLEQSLLKIIRLGILGHCQVHGKVLRWEQAESYSIDNDELDEYAKELAEDLKKAEQTHLIPCGYFEEGSPTLPDTVSEENDVPIMRAENDELEYSCSPANDGYDGSTEEVEDAQSASGDSEDAGTEPGEDGDEEAEDECEDSEDNDKSDADLQDDDDNNCEAEDGNSEDGL
ncbi:hypothetical protein BGX38DRAFT_1303080 [Terfezia claveryi]|nr:hypothetical protein BGX38DRAFT_1303080 [Terfezia claveryi]